MGRKKTGIDRRPRWWLRKRGQKRERVCVCEVATESESVGSVMSSEIISAGAGTSSKKTSAKKRLVRTAKKLFASTGKAAWIVSTTFLVLVVPLIIETDREQQLVELEQQQMGVLTAKN